MFGIMRVSKVKKQQIYPLMLENCRTKADHDNGREFPNSDIDWERTDDNIYLVKCDNWNKAINKTLEELNVKTRKNSTYLIDTVYAVSPEWWADKTLDEVKDYFQACLEFHKKAYGDHIINCVIHVDEGVREYEFENELGEMETRKVPTYHMHCQSLALKETVVPDINGTGEKKIYSLSARDILGNKKTLSQHQDNFWESVSSIWGLERGTPSAETQRKHLNKLEYQNQQMKIESDKCKAELNIRSRVLQACQEPVEIEILSENKLRKEPTSTVRTKDLERLKSQVKTAEDLKHSLAEMDRIAKETIALSSTDEKVIELTETIHAKQKEISSLQTQINTQYDIIFDWERKYNSLVTQIQEYQQNLRRWFDKVKQYLIKRNIFKEFEYYITHDSQDIKELAREEIEYDDFERG